MEGRYQNGIAKASDFSNLNSRPLMEFRMDRVVDLTPFGSVGLMSLEFRDQIIAKLSFLRYERLCNESGFALLVMPFPTIRYVLVRTMVENQSLDPETWVDQHGGALYRYALFRVQDVQVAEDLVHETLMAALRARNGFAGRSTVRTWLFGILKHKIIDHIRKVSRERPHEDIEFLMNISDDIFDERGGWKASPAEWTTDPALLSQQHEFWEILQACMLALPPD